MTTINLYQNQEEKSLISSQHANGGLFFSLGIMLITILASVGLKFYIPTLGAKSAALTDTIEAENKKTAGLKKLAQVMDMQNRTAEIKNNLQIQNNAVTRTDMNNLLDKLSADMSTGVVVSNYEYGKDLITVDLDANNYADAAKQLINFKNSGYFTEINLNSIVRKENTITSVISMEYKKS